MLAVSCTTALADEQDGQSVSRKLQTQSIAVTYSDLNLSQTAGVETLYSRLKLVANEVCAPTEKNSRHLLMRLDWKRCVSNALDNVVAGGGIPELQQIHFATTGRQVGGTVSAIAKVD